MEAIGTIGAVIGIIDAIIRSYEAIEKIRNLPRAFETVKLRLPLVQETLDDVKSILKSNAEVRDTEKATITNTIRSCEQKAEILKGIIQKLEKNDSMKGNAPKIWTKFQKMYQDALNGTKANRVESLMTEILKDVKALSMTHVFRMHKDVANIAQSLDKALDDLAKVQPSLPDSEFENGGTSVMTQNGDCNNMNNVWGGRGHHLSHITGNNHNFTYVSSSREPLVSHRDRNWRQILFHSVLWSILLCFLPSSAATTIEMWIKGLGRRTCHHIPFEQNSRFVGRVEALNKLQAMLTGHSRRTALVGLGGIGKTELALRIAYWVREHMKDYSVFWVTATTKESFEDSYRNIVHQLVDDGHISQTSSIQDTKWILQRHLSSEDAGQWLMIVDDADDLDVLQWANEYFPKSSSGRLLFTTRSSDIGRLVADQNCYKLPDMNEGEAMRLFDSLLTEQLEQSESKSDKAHLLKELDHLPLAIKHATAYLVRNEVPISTYRRLLCDSLVRREFPKSNDPQLLKTSLATTWIVSFDRIRGEDPVAARLLGLLSLLLPKAIPRLLLEGLASDEDLTNAIGTLLGYAFIARRSNEDAYDMHGLVQIVTRLWHEQTGEFWTLVCWAWQHFDTMIDIKFGTIDFEEEISTTPLQRQFFYSKLTPHILRVLRICGERRILRDKAAMLSFKMLRIVAGELRDLFLTENELQGTQEMIAFLAPLLEEMRSMEPSKSLSCISVPDEYWFKLLSLRLKEALAAAYFMEDKKASALKLLGGIRTEFEALLGGGMQDLLINLLEKNALSSVFSSEAREGIKLLRQSVKARRRQLAERRGIGPLHSYEEVCGEEESSSTFDTTVEENAKVLINQHFLAFALLAQDASSEEGRELLGHILKVRRRVLGEQHELTVSARDELAKFENLR